MTRFIGAIDQGTTSTRFIVFNAAGEIVAIERREHAQICPRPGWVEHDAAQIWRDTRAVIGGALAKAGLAGSDLAAIGVTNQRETTVLWDKATGAPLHNAIVWMDTRNDELVARFAADGGVDRLRAKTGLPLASYFSGLKLAWLFENLPGARERAENGEILFGTMDSWLIWNLTGGPRGGRHATDATNASRTQMMNLATLQWDDAILRLFDIPRACLPEIRSSERIFWRIPGRPARRSDRRPAGRAARAGLPEARRREEHLRHRLLPADEQRRDPHISSRGLITTLAYKLGDAKPVYALEGSIAIAGALVQWLRDNLGVIESSGDVEALARTVADNGDIYFVPAFSGLYAPRWRADARGVIAGLTRFSNKGHIARAALEAAAYQTREVLAAMTADAAVSLKELRVDGGMAANELLMQFQADILDVPVVRPRELESTALGAAYAAGLAVGFWRDPEDIAAHWREERRWTPAMSVAERQRLVERWEKAVERSLGWMT